MGTCLYILNIQDGVGSHFKRSRPYKTVIGTINLNTTKLKGLSMLIHNVTLFYVLWLENHFVGNCRKIR